ncbi:MAG: ribosome small subunit-dependent GTPase A [Clostridia bacterium]|nr:ribosome small subunit-dependent GTPase A [Clostridia bacterium]
MEGIILSGIGGFYTVLEDSGARHTLRAQGKLRRQRLTPLVGDRVVFRPGEGGQHGWLEAILPRRSELIRPPVANIDLIGVVVSAGTPAPDLLLADRMLMFARRGGIEAALIVNKCDEDGAAAEAIARQYAGSGARVFLTCAATGEGVDALKAALSGRVHALGGQSGVGKSSLLNRMYGFSRETGALSEKIERGKNTTRHCELIPLPDGGMALDTPGFSLLELPLCDPYELRFLVPELEKYEGECRFQPCAHVSEPGCAARAAVERGEVSRERWSRYCELFEDMKTRWRERYD